MEGTTLDGHQSLIHLGNCAKVQLFGENFPLLHQITTLSGNVVQRRLNFVSQTLHYKKRTESVIVVDLALVWTN